MIKLALSFGLAVAAAAASDTGSPHADDTIYILRGDAEALRRFQAELGEHWSGGTIVDQDAADGEIRYWAYAKRTAQEARAFLIPAARSGLELKIDQYQESVSFPVLRKRLDGLVVECQQPPSSLWIQPTGRIDFNIGHGFPSAAKKCLEDALSRSKLQFSPSDNRSN